MRTGRAVWEPNRLPYAATVVAPELNSLLTGADHVDVKITEANVTLREFVSGVLEWQPGWIRMLFRARVVFARMLRLHDPSCRQVRARVPRRSRSPRVRRLGSSPSSGRPKTVTSCSRLLTPI